MATVTRFEVKKVVTIFAFKRDPNLRHFPSCIWRRSKRLRETCCGRIPGNGALKSTAIIIFGSLNYVPSL